MQSLRAQPKKKKDIIYDDEEELAKRMFIRAWNVFRIASLATLCACLVVAASTRGTVWKNLRCPRVAVSQGEYMITCSDQTDGSIPLIFFPILAAAIFFAWDCARICMWRFNCCDYDNESDVKRGNPQSMCNMLVFPLLVPPIVYFGIQPCLNTILVFTCLEAILRWIWYTVGHTGTYKRAMAYVFLGNIAKFAIIYSYIQYTSNIPDKVRSYLIADLAFTLLRAAAFATIHRGRSEGAVPAEWTSTVLQHVQFLVQCWLSAKVSWADL